MLADPLLARDRAPFLRRDDLLPDLLELSRERRELRLQGVRVADSAFARASAAPRRRLDPVDEGAHVAEEGVNAHRRVELLLPVGERCTARGGRGRSSSFVSMTSLPFVSRTV